MSNDADYLYAKELQAAFDVGDDSDIEEVDFKNPALRKQVSKKPIKVKRSNPHSNLDEEYVNRGHKMWHPQWDTLDPTPDIKAIFKQYDSKLFKGRLRGITIEWGTNMQTCAGICYAIRSSPRKDVTIMLSQPLLGLRPRKDLIETILRQMVFAFLFVSKVQRNATNCGKFMARINRLCGTNISAQKSYLEETRRRRQWWRCNGICQDRAPFAGYVITSINHIPDATNQWFPKHLIDCGGTFMKIKGPAGSTITKDTSYTATEVSSRADHGSFQSSRKESQGLGSNSLAFTGRLLQNALSSDASSIAAALPPSSYPGLSSDPFNIDISSSGRNENTRKTNASANVVGFKDLGANKNSPGLGRSTNFSSDSWGQGCSLLETNKKSNVVSKNLEDKNKVDRAHLRDVWSKRFQADNKESNKRAISEEKDKDEDEGDTKRRRVSTENPPTKESGSKNSENNKTESDKWHAIDEEIMLKDYKEPVITLSSDDEDEDSKDTDDKKRLKINKDMTIDERQSMIKQEIIDESIDLTDEDIELIDDEYDDTIATSNGETSSTSLRDNDFCSDLMADYKKENDCRPSSSHHQSHPDDDIITCFICLEKMPRRAFGDHIDGCTGITNRILPPKSAMKKLSAISKEARPKKSARPSTQTTRDILRKAGYTDADLARIASADETDGDEDFLSDSGAGRGNRLSASATSVQDLNSSSEDENTRRYRQRNLYKTTRECPVCKADVEESEMNDHLDECLSK